MKETKLRALVATALIGAMYTALTLALAPVSFGALQCRVSEALTLLPVYSPVAVWGVTLGCALSNIAGVITGTNILGVLDVFFGTAATFLAAWLSYGVRNVRVRGLPVLSAIPPIVLNGLVIGGELTWVMTGRFDPAVFWIQAAGVAAGEAVSCLGLGLLMVWAMDRAGLGKSLFSQPVPSRPREASR